MVSRVIRFASIAVRYLGYANKLLSVLSMLVIASLVVIVSLQVFVRYFFKEPIDWNSGPYKLGLDKWPVLALMAIGLLLLCLNIMVSLIRQIADLIYKERDN